MRYFALLWLILGVTACSTPPGSTGQTHSIGVRYAKHFRIEPHEGYAVLQILQPETGDVEHTYALVKDADRAKVPVAMERIAVPVKNMAVLSTTMIGMLDALHALDCIKGTTDVNFVSNPTVKKGVQSGAMANFTSEISITPERLLSKDISLVVYSGFGKEFSNEAKLKKLGIYAMPDYDWREEHPLGKAEWIKVFGYLTGKERQAEAYFNEVEKTYNSTKKELTHTRTHPSVLVGSLIGDVWYAPAGQSYMAHILRDAGADYLYKNEPGTGSTERTLEQVFKDQESVKIWINPGAVSLTGLQQQQPKYALFTAFQSGEVFCYTHNSNYFWEMSAVNPHWLLSDFAAIIRTKSTKKLHFYRKLEK